MRTTISGSLMVEYVVYSGVVCILLFVSVHYTSSLYQNVKKKLAHEFVSLQLSSVLGLLRNDLWQAPISRSSWLCVHDNELIWRTKDNDIGWVLLGSDLYRVQGSYDKGKSHWHAKNRALIARNIATFSAKTLPNTNNDKTIQCVFCTIVSSICQKEITWHVVLRASLAEI